MLLYEKIVNGVKQGIYGTLGKIPSENDQHVIYKDKNGNILTDVKYGDRFRDDKAQGMDREQDGKNVTVWIGNTMVIPPYGQVGPTPSLVSIAFTAEPTKKNYVAGESINMAGAVVTATYDNETTADVTSLCDFEPKVAAMGVTAITATFQGKTATTPITVTEPVVLQSIAFTAEPLKKAYIVGETINITGAVVTAYYSDSTSAVVTNDCTFNPANGTPVVLGMDKIVATYQGKSAEVAITVDPAPVTNLYYGVTDDVPTSVTGLTAVPKTKNQLIADGFSVELTTNDQYSVIAVDKSIGVRLTKMEQAGFQLTFITVDTTNQTIYYGEEKSTDTAVIECTFAVN